MATSNHKLLLGMYSFQIKKRNTSNKDIIDLNTFLSDAYPNAEKKFSDGFAKEVISFFDEKAFKNDKKTHGGTLDDKSIASEKRYFDLLIDGGITGIQQFLVNDEGERLTISKDKIVGLKFARPVGYPPSNRIYLQLNEQKLAVSGRICNPTFSYYKDFQSALRSK